MTIATEPPSRFSNACRLEDIERAKRLLRSPSVVPTEAFDVAERLKEVNEFGYARRLLGRIREAKDYTGLESRAVKIGHRHSLCTYKDTDIQASERFRRALAILDEVDRQHCTRAEQQETLGQRGAIHKRMWQVEGQRKDLLRSLSYYVRGFQMGAATDQGYNGINAAFVYDLLAREEVAEAELTGAHWSVADDYWRRGREIRLSLAQSLPGMPDKPGGEWMKTQWWFFATVAEARYGLGQFDLAIGALRQFNREKAIAHCNPPLEAVPPWEFESTISQLGTLAGLQADILERLSRFPDWKPPEGLDVKATRSGAIKALRDYLGSSLAPGADRAFQGKLGLALSGGGFRASLFHIGVLARLAEQDLLRRVEVLSCVSGGSIIGAHYYLELQRLLLDKSDVDIERKDYVEIVERVAREFLAGVQTNIRCTLFGDIVSNLRMFLQPGYTTTRRLAELYESAIYSRVPDGKGASPRRLEDLIFVPKGETENFKPKYDNWRRAAKVPELVLNATTLNTGRNWQFTASWMGEPPSRLDAEIGGNYLLRRMYHKEAPRMRDKWLHPFLRPFGPLDYRTMRVGHAVAASSCVPGLFEPLVLDELFDGKRIRLVDGGVYDNQGVASLLEQDCNVLIVSDASGQMEAQDLPSGGRLGVPIRSFGVSMSRVRQAQFAELDARRRSGLLKGLVFLHLRKDLHADPLDWRECQDPIEASDEAGKSSSRSVNTSYVLSKSIQRLLSALRTDLDSFTELESYALMTSGYYQLDASLRSRPDIADVPREEKAWQFLDVLPVLTPGKGYDDVEKCLRTGSMTGGKIWLQDPFMMAIGIALIVALIGASLWWCLSHWTTSLLTVGSLCLLAGVLVMAYALPHATRLIRFRKTARDIGLRALAGTLLAVGFKFHLWFIDSRFLSRGRLKRHREARDS